MIVQRFCILFGFVILVPRFLQFYRRDYLEDSRSFNGDPPHLTLNRGFPVFPLSQPKKVQANVHSTLLQGWRIWWLADQRGTLGKLFLPVNKPTQFAGMFACSERQI